MKDIIQAKKEADREVNRLRVAQWRLDNPERHAAIVAKQLERNKKMRQVYKQLEADGEV